MFKNALALALLVHGAHAECDGVVSTFTAECTFDNFIANLNPGCGVATLYPEGDAEDQIAIQCAYGAPVKFGDIQGTYQRDRRYFAGGGTMVDGGNFKIAAAPVARFEANLASDTLIAFPEYAVRVAYNVEAGFGTNGYPANMNLETGCDLNTVMCCFAEGDFAGGGDATTDVCHHDLHDSPESSHIKEGWSAFPDGETPTHCVGFTWKEGEDELLGNMMYDVSLRNSVTKGYLKGVPGAPMCGCIESMPVVEEAACRTAEKVTEITYTFTYEPATEDTAGYLSASNRVTIDYLACAAGDLKAQYKANHAGDATAEAEIDDHLVGAGGCTVEAETPEGYLSKTRFTVKGSSVQYADPDPNVWSELIAGGGLHFLPPAHDYAGADVEFRGLIEAGCQDDEGHHRHCLVRRVCPSCQATHTDVYYQRLTALPTADINFLDVFLNNWHDAQNSMAAGDFALYSTHDDARAGVGAWTFCDYKDEEIGFPRNCGPHGLVGSNWNSLKHTSHARHHGFFVEKPPFSDFNGEALIEGKK